MFIAERKKLKMLIREKTTCKALAHELGWTYEKLCKKLNCFADLKQDEIQDIYNVLKKNDKNDDFKLI
ncbi:MAG: hypothetical protein ABIA63_03025 [bacterium]